MSSTIKSPAGRKADPAFRWVTAFCALSVFVIMGGLFVELVDHSKLSIQKFGLGFLTSQTWNPVIEEFGAASSIFGTLASTAIAMLLAAPLSLVIVVFLVELAPPAVSSVVGSAIELLAAIPSIIYGMWGMFVFAPFVARHVQPALGKYLGSLPLFQGPPIGIGMMTAGIILALMILPFISAVARDSLRMVPATVKESGYGMGGTTWEVTRRVSLPYCRLGVVGAMFLGLGRAVGETMAVTFVIGNKHTISASLFSPGNSIASTLANEFAEAAEPMYLSALVELGLVLLAVTLVIQVIAQLWLSRMVGMTGGEA